MMIQYNNYIPSPYNDWQEIDIIVSRDCTLRCAYCYLQKHADSVYDIDAIMASLDKLLQEALNADKPGVVLSFYPEPWVNIQRTNTLIKRALELLLKYDRFTANYMIMLGTNGVNLHKPIPILKNLSEHLSLNVTLDGVKEQHDKYRVFADGSPSWEIIKNNILTYQDNYRIYGTKVTLGPDTIKYIYESSRFLWDEMHFKDINMNVVYEPLWTDKEKSLIEFEKQLQLLYDDIVTNRRWEHEQYQSLLGYRQIPSMWVNDTNEHIGQLYCGAIAMRSIDSDGSIYPCFRLSPYSLNENKQYGLNNPETARAMKLLNPTDMAPQKCRECEYLSICSVCVGGVVEEVGSLYWRTTHHCEFQILQSKYAYKLYQRINDETAVCPNG